MSVDLVVVGGGVIGASCAWRAAQAGLEVVLLEGDSSTVTHASRTAAGMLAPVSELNFGEEALLRLGLASLQRYPHFVDELQEATGIDAGYRSCGTLVLAWDGADLAGLRDLQQLHSGLGLAAELVSPHEARDLQPGLAPGLPGGLWIPGDHQVDNRALLRALLAACDAVGVRRRSQAVRAVTSRLGAVTGVRTGKGDITAPKVLLAAGAGLARIDGVPEDVRDAVHPVKGQTLRLRVGDRVPGLRRVVRGRVKGSAVYLVPREGGEVVIGASSESAGFDLTPRAGAVYELLRDAVALFPAVAEMSWAEVSTGLRPGTADNAPLIGCTGIDGLLVAGGHHRNGILLTPVTAEAISDLVTGREPSVDLAPFAPRRFGVSSEAAELSAEGAL